MESSDLPSENYPPALSPVYTTDEPNQPILLYEGSLEIAQNGTVQRGEGTVRFEWFPSPRVAFDFSGQDHCRVGILPDQADLKLLDLRTPVAGKCRISSSSLDFFSHSGFLSEDVISASADKLSYLLFHLTNFYDFFGNVIVGKQCLFRGRLVLEAQGWKVTIDSLENLKNIKKTLKTKGGYCITHIGKIEHSPQNLFDTKEVDNLLTALGYFCSFCRGFWTFPILPVGYDINGDKVWEQWAAYKATPWKSVSSWFPDSTALVRPCESLSMLFPGFWHRWQNPIWHQPIRLAIDWYIQSNAHAGSIESSIIMAQAAFELLSIVLLVEDKRLVNSKEFDRLPAAKKLRQLLVEFGIPLNIPDSLSNLKKFSAQLNWMDGPQALTRIRNIIVHSGKPQERTIILNAPYDVLYEAKRLSLWYLELILLHLFDYRGDYCNRVSANFMNPLDPVPWN
ncbi:MAG TPA: hypothetical protein DCL61_18760 [Cyanobacteria bacterium UBA12227]|nr:hypothetical protein [Cyanobacteria bacterium UBA12227]HAX89918.1 hypothetical protein [Cyanobacteria bacterium UBA11370]